MKGKTMRLLPLDPDNQNHDRAEWARAGVEAMADQTGVLRAGDGMEEAIHDLLGNLMHLCDREGIDFNNVLIDARECYAEETDGTGPWSAP
jgi:hypothetical protein